MNGIRLEKVWSTTEGVIGAHLHGPDKYVPVAEWALRSQKSFEPDINAPGFSYRVVGPCVTDANTVIVAIRPLDGVKDIRCELTKLR